MAQAALKTKEVKNETKEPEIKPVEVKRVQIDDAGFAWRTVLARMPEGSTQDDLRDPKIWRRAQRSPQTSLQQLDHILILAFDESWFARAIVAHVGATEAHLVIEKVGSFREKSHGHFTDGTLEIFWDGSAYGVRRCSDAVRVINEGFLTEGQAIAALRNYYPKRVG